MGETAIIKVLILVLGLVGAFTSSGESVIDALWKRGIETIQGARNEPLVPSRDTQSQQGRQPN